MPTRGAGNTSSELRGSGLKWLIWAPMYNLCTSQSSDAESAGKELGGPEFRSRSVTTTGPWPSREIRPNCAAGSRAT